MRNVYNGTAGKPESKKQLEDLGTDGKILVKCMRNK
jgi:hypothetical protein